MVSVMVVTTITNPPSRSSCGGVSVRGASHPYPFGSRRMTADDSMPSGDPKKSVRVPDSALTHTPR